MVELGHSLNLTVVGEGVESEVQAAALRALGCDLAQGYHFGHPVTAAALWATGVAGGAGVSWSGP